MSIQVDDQLPLILMAHRARDTVELLKALLEREGFTTLCAYNGRSALQYARQHHPVLLLLDQALPLLDGIELCRTLRQEIDDPAIFILCDQPDELGKLLAFAAGADDCLALPFHPRELLARIKAVLRRTQRQPLNSRQVLRYGSLELDPEQRRVRVSGEAIVLTGLEYELLYLLLQHPGRAFPRSQLLAQLQAFQHGTPLDRAVDIHISNLRRKLSKIMEIDISIETVRGIGYRLSVLTSETPLEASSTAAEQGPVALAAFERIPLPMLVLDADRTVILYNEAARRLCGWPADHVIGQAKCYSLLQCHHVNDTMLCHEHCIMQSIVLNRLSDQTAQYSITLKDGREVPVTAHYSNLAQPGTRNGYILLTLEPDLAATQLP